MCLFVVIRTGFVRCGVQLFSVIPAVYCFLYLNSREQITPPRCLFSPLPLFFIIIFVYQKSNSAVIQLKLHFFKYIYCVSFHKIGHNKLINYFGYSPGKFGLLMYCTVVDAVKVIIDEHAVPAEIKQKQFILLLPRT